MCETPSSLNIASHDCLITINRSWRPGNHDNQKSNVNSKSFINIHVEVSENKVKIRGKSISIKVEITFTRSSFVLWHLIHGFPLLLSLTLICFFTFFFLSVIITVLLPASTTKSNENEFQPAVAGSVAGVGRAKHGALEQKQTPEMSPATSKQQFSRCRKNIESYKIVYWTNFSCFPFENEGGSSAAKCLVVVLLFRLQSSHGCSINNLFQFSYSFSIVLPAPFSLDFPWRFLFI